MGAAMSAPGRARSLLRGLLSARRVHGVALARPPLIASLAAVPGVTVHSLEEHHRPAVASLALGAPASVFTPACASRLVQHLIVAEAPAGFRSEQGLLAWNRSWLYEASLANAEAPDRLDLGLPQLLAPSLRDRRHPAALPPGWWRSPAPLQEAAAPLLLLSTHNNPNYHHWLTLPGLAPLMLQEHFALEPPAGLSLALSSPPGRPQPAFVAPLLELLAPGVPLLVGPALSASRLRFALQEHHSAVVVSPALLAWWRRRLAALMPPAAGPRRRWLISRQGARARRCLNEAALLRALEPLGFALLVPETLTSAQQLRAFAAAEVVVGAHGAGLTNVLACRAGATLVELLPGEGPFNHYFLMASVLGLRHAHLIGERPDPASQDFVVDPQRLLELLERCGLEVER